MSDNKDKDATESSVEFDFDSTVELDLSKLGIATSADEHSLDDDFDETLNGLMEIDELLKEESSPVSETDNHEQELSSEALDFDELNAGIEDLMEPAEEANKNFMGDEYMPETTEKREESDDMFDLDISDLPDEDAEEEEENEFLIKHSASAADERPPLELPNDEEIQPLVELTEEMLDQPEETDDQAISDLADDFLSTRENDLLSEAVNEFAEKNSGIDKTIVNDAETPELTTTETDIISAAATDIDEEEDIPEIEVEAVISPQPETPAVESAEEPVAEPARGGGSNTIPLLFGILGIAIGGFGAWMAFDATGKVADLERRIQTLSAMNNNSQNHDIADIQQRLGKVERRLTGMPTIEAAASLGATSTIESAPLEPVQEPALQLAPITPKTPISSDSSKGDWVVNASSHTNEELATKESARLLNLGLNPEVHTATIKGRTWYRVQITGFASKDEAKAKLRDLQQRLGIKGAWIGKR